MKNKLISLSIIFIFVFTSLISAEAIATTPRVDLDDYQIVTTDKTNVYVSGTVSVAKGQTIAVYDSAGKYPFATQIVGTSGGSDSFRIKIDPSYLQEGTNTFKIKSMALKGVLNGSNPKTFTVTVKDATKKDQVITASDLTLKVGESKNLNAKVNSGLSLTYTSSDPSIATVDATGKVIGRAVGTTKVTISQAGNNEYKATSKVITITVKSDGSSTPTPTKQTYTIVYNPNGGKGAMASQKVEVGKSVKLSANKFTKDGYKFVGWADASHKQIMSGTHIENWKNVNMKHFQLGTVVYKNKVSVKNLATKNKQVVLYAVWKGNGPQAAVDWATLIAKDNNFTYGKKQSSNWRGTGNDRSHRHGCYFCGTNRNKPKGKYRGKAAKPWNTKKNTLSAQSTDQKYDKTYCCNPFVIAAYVHGANEKSKCGGGSMTHSSWTGHKGNGKFKKISKNAALQPGDVFFSSGHVWMCGNKNSKGKWTVLEASGSSWSAKSIAVKVKNPKRSNTKGRVRYYPNN